MSVHPDGPLTILVVDDSRDTADSTAELLCMLGYAAHAAYGGGQALAFCQAQPPDVVLLDLSMPEMNGFTLAARIRQGLPARRPLMIAVTAHPADRIRDGVMNAGFDGCFVKPADMNALGKLLRRFEPLVRAGAGTTDGGPGMPPGDGVFDGVPIHRPPQMNAAV